MKASTLFGLFGFGLLLVAVPLLAGNPNFSIYSSSDSTCNLPKFLCFGNKQKRVFVQFVLQPNTPETARITEDLIYLVSRRVRPKHHIEISRLSGDSGLEVFYSSSANRRAIQELHWELDGDPGTAELAPTPSSEEALVPGVQRLRDRIRALTPGQELHFYLVTEGTGSTVIISQLTEITESLADEDLGQVHVYVIGLNESNRFSFPSAFHPIAEHVSFSSSNIDNEWIPLLRKF